MRFDLAFERVHVAVRVEHAALARFQGGDGVELRLQRARFGAAEPAHAFDAVDFALLGQAFERFDLAVLGGDDELAAFVVGDSVRVEERIERAPAGDAEARLQRSGGIMQPGVDDFGIARGDAGADARVSFQHDNGSAAPRERIAARQADCACPYDRHVKVAHVGRRTAALAPALNRS